MFDEVETVERPTTEISQVPVHVPQDSPAEKTVDTQAPTEFIDPVIAELTSTTPQSSSESDSADLDGAESQSAKKDDSESNSDVRPPKIPSWDEILFGPTSEND